MGIFVYVGNLGSATTEEMVRTAFVKGGNPIRSVVILRSPHNDRSRGFGFVELESQAEADAAALAMNGVELEGRPLRVGAVRERAPVRRGEGFQSYSGLGGRLGGPRRPGGAKRKRG